MEKSGHGKEEEIRGEGAALSDARLLWEVFR
jgi:hypothetical protein